MTTLIRNTLNDLERSIKNTGYTISISSKTSGDTVVRLTRRMNDGSTRIFEGEGTHRSSFPYQDAIKQANARMRQYEDRFNG